MDDMQELATALHTLQCHSSHEDICGWEREINLGEWERWTHKYYLEKAEKLYGRVPQRPPAIIAVVKALGDL